MARGPSLSAGVGQEVLQNPYLATLTHSSGAQVFAVLANGEATELFVNGLSQGSTSRGGKRHKIHPGDISTDPEDGQQLSVASIPSKRPDHLKGAGWAFIDLLHPA